MKALILPGIVAVVIWAAVAPPTIAPPDHGSAQTHITSAPSPSSQDTLERARAAYYAACHDVSPEADCTPPASLDTLVTP